MTAIEFLNKHYNNPRIILKDRGNRGYYIKYNICSYDYSDYKTINYCDYRTVYISKKSILKHSFFVVIYRIYICLF